MTDRLARILADNCRNDGVTQTDVPRVHILRSVTPTEAVPSCTNRQFVSSHKAASRPGKDLFRLTVNPVVRESNEIATKFPAQTGRAATSIVPLLDIPLWLSLVIASRGLRFLKL